MFTLRRFAEELNSRLVRVKQTRIIHALELNNFDLFKELLDSPKWHNTTDTNGNNLLQIAVVKERKEVFDYLLSLPDYPLEFKNANGRTALELALNCVWTEEKEYFACELIKKGAHINKIYDRTDTLLHSACKRGFAKASLLLIEKEIDVNACGYNNYTPLQRIFNNNFHSKQDEIIFMLLEFGANPSVRDRTGYISFENSVRYSYPNEIQEALFYYTFDEFSFLKIHLQVLVKLAANNLPLLDEITKRQFEIIVETNQSSVKSCLKNLCFINPTNLRILITKFDKSFKILFAQLSEVDFHNQIAELSIEKLNILIESSLRDEIINNFIPLIRLGLYQKIKYSQNESELTEYICYLLSYGIEINGENLCLIYEKFGYCELFKILLHMDIKKKNCYSYFLPRLLINITKNLEDIIQNTDDIPSQELRKLMNYFSHPKLHSMYREENINVPQVPSLLELSRNVFRSYFIKKFQIKTSSQFYTLLNCLKINLIYKKIITYETKLYSP